MDTPRTENPENFASPPDVIVNNNQDAVKEIIVKELERKSNGSVWLWVLFILCATPNVIGGLHISFYLFISQPPEDFYCVIGELADAGWTTEQIRNILGGGKKACNIPNWNYTAIAEYDYETFMSNSDNWHILAPSQEYIPCLSQASNYYEYIQEAGTSIVTEWDLICENTVWRSTVQGAQSFGRVIGSPIVGILADKYGRKSMFSWSSIIMIISGIVATFTPWYSFLLVGRFGIGFASQGVLYPLQILATENADVKHRTAISCIINMTYAFGVILLAVIAMFITTWRQLSFAVSLPALVLLFNMYYLIESPRWLLTKGRIIEAYAAVFRSKIPTDLLSKLKKDHTINTSDYQKLSIMQKIKSNFNDLIFLYRISKWRKIILVCHLTWFIILLCYYVTVLNAHNQSTNIYVYSIGIGVIDIFGDLLAIYITRNCGRRSSSYLLFILTSFFLLIVLCFPKNYSIYFGIFSRLGIICLYSILSLHMIEMFPTSCRTYAIGLTSFFSNLGTILAPYVVDLLGPIAWWLPNAICGVSTIIAAFASLLLPETKSDELEDHHVN